LFSSPRQFFSARPLHLEQEGRAQISGCASGAGGRTCHSEAARMGWRGVLYGVHCRCFCSLIVKEELNIFSLGFSPDLEAEEKMWWGVCGELLILAERDDDVQTC
jgi:hypothetical protein